MSINLSALMKQRYDTAANWTAQNPTLLAGEIGIESDTKKWKVGTGSTAWTSLAYAIGGTYPIVNADIAAGAAIVDAKLATITTAGKVSNSATTATSAYIASTIVARDASGNFSAGSITASLNGIAAHVITNANLTGDVTSVGNATAIAAGVIVDADVNASAAIADTKLATIATAGKVSNSATTAASANTPSAIVARDASGNFTAGTITAALTGAASSNVLKAGDTMTGVLAVTAGTAALPGIAVSGDPNTGIYSPGADQLAIATGGTEKVRIDSGGRLLVGASSAFDTSFSTLYKLGIEQNSASSIFALKTNAANTSGSILSFGKSRGTTANSKTIVQSNDFLGGIIFDGADGAFMQNAAAIFAQVDGTPGIVDMPGRLVFFTTADGTGGATEALRITNDRVLAYNQPTPATYAAAATLTVADLKTKIITYTGTAATLTLPTGTLAEGGFAGIYTNMTFEWSVINTGAGICTIGAGTDHTIVGSGTVAIGGSARFASRRTAANTFVSYRLV